MEVKTSLLVIGMSRTYTVVIAQNGMFLYVVYLCLRPRYTLGQWRALAQAEAMR